MEETITIFKVDTNQPVQSISDLRENVKKLKEALEGATIGTKAYKDTLELLKVNQNALKDAMYATTGKLEDVTAAAKGASESYNSLVHRMAALKEEFRATNDEARRANLGQQIKDVNDRLKELDALQGNFQRNVGNYAGSIKDAFHDMSVNADAFGKSLGAVGGGVNGIKNGFDAFSKSPSIATIGLLVSVCTKLAEELKDNEKVTVALKKALDALKPVMDFLSGILEDIATFVADLISQAVEFVTSNGLFDKIVKGVMGVGNAIVKYVTAPFKGVIEAIKVFKEKGVKGLGEAAKAFGQEMKTGLSFKQNFQAGQVAADTILEGAASRKKKAKDTGKDVGKEAGKGFAEGMYDEAMKSLKRGENSARAWREAYAEWEKGLADAEKEAMAEVNAEIEQDFQDRVDALKKELEEEERLRKEDLKKQEEIAKAKKALLQGVASATSDILGDIADLYEADSEGAEKNANKIKALRIAAATVDTISGAIGAFMQASATYPPPYGQILGAIEAAAITATGIDQIAKMKSTNVSTEGGASASPTVSAAVSAPTLQTNVANVRTVTSASEEDRLNRMASDRKVYLVTSELEAHQQDDKVRLEEATF